MKTIKLQFIAPVFTAFVFFSQTSWAQIDSNRNRITLVTSSLQDTAKKVIKATDFTIKVVPLKVNSSMTIEDILSQYKINPLDRDIYKLLYELNPGITQLDSLADNQVLNIPKFKFSNRPTTNEVFTLHLDDSLINDIEKKCSFLFGKINSSDSLRLKTDYSSDYVHMSNSILKLRQVKLTLQERSKIISHNQLVDFSAEASQLIDCINHPEAVENKNQVTVIDNNMSAWTKSLFELKSSATLPLAPDAQNPTTYVSVTKVANNQKVLLAGYTIYYCAPGVDLTNKHVFGENSSNTVAVSDKIPECTWNFWATKAGTPPDSQIKMYTVRRGNENQIELSIPQ